MDGVVQSKTGRRIAKQKLLSDAGGDIEMGTMSEPPSWVRLVEGTMTLFEVIRTKKEELSKAMGKSKRIGFDEDTERRRKAEITDLAADISALFKRCEQNIQGVMDGRDKRDTNDCAMRKNVQSSLATQLHQLSVTFRRDQKKYLEKLKENEAKSRYLPQAAESNSFADEGFSEHQLLAVEDAEESVEAREREIVQVAEGIRDLQTIFKELAVLIIDQGTIIDRIDYNIERAAQHTKDASEQLAKAERSQRRNPAMCCIMCLTAALGLMTIILVMKLLGFVDL